MSEKLILVTNDDGIDAPGIRLLAQTAKEFGTVYVVAPDSAQSAMSHRVSYFKPVEVKDHDFGIEGIKAFSVSGSPADCVRVGALKLLPRKPDVVLSGINYGYNISGDIQYSGTASAALEGAFLGIHSIAFSHEACDVHETTEKFLKELMAEYINVPLKENTIWNINFPDCKASECKGIKRNVRVAYDGFYDDSYKEEITADGRRILEVVADRHWERCPEGTDVAAIRDGYISVGTVTNVM